MADDPLLVETRNGKLSFGGNELLVDALDLDAAAIRLGAPEDQRALGKISGDVRNADGHGRDEVVLIILKQSGEGVPDHLKGGEIFIGCRIPGHGSTDSAMAEVAKIFHDRVQFNVPISAPNLSGGTVTASPSAIESPNGRYRLQCQDDGHAVFYDMRSPTGIKALWSSRFGVIG